MRKISCKIFLSLVLVLLISLVSFAQEIVIHVATDVGGAGVALSGGIQLFNEKYSGKYRVEQTMIAFDELRDKLLTQFISKDPVFEVFAVNSTWRQQVISYLYPLDELINTYGPKNPEQVFGPGLVDQWKSNGVIIALPVRIGTAILFYRQDWLSEAGFDKILTLDDYYSAAQKMTVDFDGDGNIDRYGSSIKLASPTWSTESLAAFFMPHGGWFLNEDLNEASSSLNSKLMVDILNFIKKQWDEKLIPDPLAWTFDDNVAGFQTGKIAMSSEFSARSLLLEDPEKSEAAGKMGYSLMPSQPIGPHPMRHYGASHGLAIDKNIKPELIEAAYAFVSFMASQEAQEFMAINHANGPTLISMYEDPEYIKLNPAALAIRDSLLSNLGDLFPLPESPQAMELIHRELQNVITERKTTTQAADDMYQGIQSLIEKRR